MILEIVRKRIGRELEEDCKKVEEKKLFDPTLNKLQNLPNI